VIRIIAGKFGGRTIKTPGNQATHPMSERIRAAIFNKLSNRLAGAMVLDVFAGSGALGLEALSRGAKQVTLVEKNRQALGTISENITSLDLWSAIKLERLSLAGWLNITLSKGDEEFQKYDIIFADPPYHDPQVKTIRRLALLLADDGVLVVSYPKSLPTPDIDGLQATSKRIYAGASIIYYGKTK
jgi:16S rRNA (guanine(966)-N(2))-methyltransferase RsmD